MHAKQALRQLNSILSCSDPGAPLLGELPGKQVWNCAPLSGDSLTLSPALFGAHRWPVAKFPLSGRKPSRTSGCFGVNGTRKGQGG